MEFNHIDHNFLPLSDLCQFLEKHLTFESLDYPFFSGNLMLYGKLCSSYQIRTKLGTPLSVQFLDIYKDRQTPYKNEIIGLCIQNTNKKRSLEEQTWLVVTTSISINQGDGLYNAPYYTSQNYGRSWVLRHRS